MSPAGAGMNRTCCGSQLATGMSCCQASASICIWFVAPMQEYWSAWLQAIQVLGNMTHLKLWCPGSLRNCSISNVKEIRSAVPTIGATLVLFSTSLSIPSPSSLGNMNIMDKLFPQFPSFTASCTTTSWAWRMALACNAVNRHNRAQTVKWLAKILGHGRYHLFLQWNWWIFIPSWPASLRPKAIETVSGVGENSNSPNKICRGRGFFTIGGVVAPEIGIRRSLSPKNLGQFLFGAVSFYVFPMSFGLKTPFDQLLGALDDIDVFSANGRLAVAVRLTPHCNLREFWVNDGWTKWTMDISWDNNTLDNIRYLMDWWICWCTIVDVDSNGILHGIAR